MSTSTKEDAFNQLLFKGMAGSLPNPKEKEVTQVYLEALKRHLLAWVKNVDETMQKPEVVK